jgi:type I restriction enzyme S subunit
MKAGWIKTTVGAAFDTATGGTPPKSNSAFYGNYLPLVKPPELCDAELETAEDGLSEDGAAVARIAPPNSILVSCIGNLGKIGLNVVPVAFNQQINAILPDASKATPWFMFYQTLSCSFKEQLESLASGTTVPIVNKSKFNSVEIVLPPIAEQHRIVAILDEAFDGIATAKANAEKNLQNARALFESHLQSVFTERGEGWVDKSLADVCELINGRAYKKHEMLAAGKYPLLRVGNFFTNRDWYYSDLELEQNKYCDNGDLLYAWSASFGPRIWDGGKVIYHYHIWRVLPNATLVEKRFLLHLLEWDVEQIKQAHGTGTTMMHVSKGSMESRAVPLPPLNEQEKIVALLDDLTVETQRLESLYQQKLTALDDLKKSLLNQAFSGAL